MPKNFTQFDPVTDLLNADTYSLFRSGAQKRITGQNLTAAVLALITTTLTGALGVDLGVTDTTQLAAKTTTSLSNGYLLFMVWNDVFKIRQLQVGSPAGTDVVPTDNPTKRWRQVL